MSRSGGLVLLNPERVVDLIKAARLVHTNLFPQQHSIIGWTTVQIAKGRPSFSAAFGYERSEEDPLRCLGDHQSYLINVTQELRQSRKSDPDPTSDKYPSAELAYMRYADFEEVKADHPE